MKTYMVRVQAYAPAPREHTVTVQASSFSTAISRGVKEVLKDKLNGKRPYKVNAFADRL